MEKKHPIGEHLQPIPEPVGAFIMAQPGLTPLVTANGYYWHYKDVITLLTRYREQTPTGAVWVNIEDNLPPTGEAVLVEYRSDDYGKIKYNGPEDWWKRNVKRWLDESGK